MTWKCIRPMNPHERLLIGWLVSRSVSRFVGLSVIKFHAPIGKLVMI